MIEPRLTIVFFALATIRSGWTPLMFAVEAGQETICRKLLEMGSDPNHHIDNFSGASIPRPMRSGRLCHCC